MIKLTGNKAISLTVILRIMVFSIVFILTVFSLCNAYLAFNFSQSIAQRNEKIIADSLKNQLPLAVISHDRTQIEEISSAYLQYEEIYAIEVRDANGEIIYRGEHNTADNVKIYHRQYKIIFPQDTSTFYDLPVVESDAPQHSNILGELTIYYHTLQLEQAVLQQSSIAVLLLVVAVVLSLLIFFLFNRYLNRNIAGILSTINEIKVGNIPKTRAVPLSGIKEINFIGKLLIELAQLVSDRNHKLKEALNQAVAASKKAQESEEFKDDFIRIIAHDIQNPVNTTVNLLKLLKDDIDSGASRAELSTKISVCYSSAEVLGCITAELFNLEQVNNASLVNTPSSTQLNHLFTQLHTMYSLRFQQKNIGLFFDNLKGPESEYQVYRVNIDSGKLLLILENLIENAFKFTARGAVEVSWVSVDNMLTVRVKDTGVGIPENKQALIFEKYKQLGNVATENAGGRGVGLFNVQRLLRVLKGEIKVESKPGIGSIFTVHIPYKAAQPSQLPATLTLKNAQGARAFIVDDNESACFTMAKMLQKFGITAEYECIPELGLQRIKKLNPDIAFIDFHMPEMGGDELISRAKRVLVAGTTLFCCITAEQNREKLDYLGETFDYVLRKPWDENELIKVLDHALQVKQELTDTLKKLANDTK